jgi:hypothetical protein
MFRQQLQVPSNEEASNMDMMPSHFKASEHVLAELSSKPSDLLSLDQLDLHRRLPHGLRSPHDSQNNRRSAIGTPSKASNGALESTMESNNQGWSLDKLTGELGDEKVVYEKTKTLGKSGFVKRKDSEFLNIHYDKKVSHDGRASTPYESLPLSLISNIDLSFHKKDGMNSSRIPQVKKPDFHKFSNKILEGQTASIEDSVSSQQFHQSIYSLSQPLSMNQLKSKHQISALKNQTTLDSKGLVSTRGRRANSDFPSTTEQFNMTQVGTSVEGGVLGLESPDNHALTNLLQQDLAGGKQIKFRYADFRESMRKQTSRSLSIKLKTPKSILINRLAGNTAGDLSVTNALRSPGSHNDGWMNTMEELGRSRSTSRKKKVGFSKNKMVLVFNPEN